MIENGQMVTDAFEVSLGMTLDQNFSEWCLRVFIASDEQVVHCEAVTAASTLMCVSMGTRHIFGHKQLEKVLYKRQAIYLSQCTLL